jgi:hypothetical protein
VAGFSGEHMLHFATPLDASSPERFTPYSEHEEFGGNRAICLYLFHVHHLLT